MGFSSLFFPFRSPVWGRSPVFRGRSPVFRGAKAFRAVTAPYNDQQASCCFGVSWLSGPPRPRTASSKLPAASGCVPLPGGHGPVQRPASFLLLRGAYPFQAVPAPNSDQQASLVSSWSLFEGQTLSLRCFPGCSVYGILFS